MSRSESSELHMTTCVRRCDKVSGWRGRFIRAGKIVHHISNAYASGSTWHGNCLGTDVGARLARQQAGVPACLQVYLQE